MNPVVSSAVKASYQARVRSGNEREEPIVLDVLRVNLLQLSNLDQVSQTFSANYFVHLRCINGAMDTDLLKDIHEDNPQFPKATLRPGAGWFLHQIDFPTAHEHSASRRPTATVTQRL